MPASLFLILGLVVIFFTQDPLHASRLMLIFPVFLLLLVSNIKGQQSGRSVRRRRREEPVSLWHRYTKGNLYLPILTLLYLLAVPF